MANDIIIVIDASTRDLETYTCAATQLTDGRLVLRKGADMKSLHTTAVQDIGHPVLVIGKYQAQSSAGFTEVYAWNSKNWREVAGGIGFTWENATGIHGKALRRFRKGTYGVLVPNGGKISRLNTNDQNSNPRTAEAAMLGLQMGGIGEDNVLIIEGQSDYVKAWSITHMPATDEVLKFPPEHREDIFAEKTKSASMADEPTPERISTNTVFWDIGSGSILYDKNTDKTFVTSDPEGRGDRIPISVEALDATDRLTKPGEEFVTFQFGDIEVDVDDLREFADAIRELREIVQEGTRVHDGCIEHRHLPYHYFWHPVSRVHKEGVA